MNNWVRHLSLSHFRTYQAAKLDLDHRPVVLLGSNGSGKTNLLEAVSLLSPGRGLRSASAEDMTRRPEQIGWKLQAEINTVSSPREIEITSKDGGARSVRIDGKPAPQTALGQMCRVLWLIPAMDRLWIEGSAGRRRFLDRVTLSFTPEHAQLSIEYDRAMRERNRLLKEGIRDAHWYVALEIRLSETGLAIHNNRLDAIDRLTANALTGSADFPRAALTLDDGDEELPLTVSDYADALAATRPRDLAIGRTGFGPHRSDLKGVYLDKGSDARDCSTGEQKALLISLLLANTRALTELTGAPPLLLLDEVSAHLDPNRRAALYDQICALGAQAWMTGTEMQLFESLGERAQYLQVTDQGGASHLVLGD